MHMHSVITEINTKRITWAFIAVFQRALTECVPDMREPLLLAMILHVLRTWEKGGLARGCGAARSSRNDKPHPVILIACEKKRVGFHTPAALFPPFTSQTRDDDTQRCTPIAYDPLLVLTAEQCGLGEGRSGRSGRGRGAKRRGRADQTADMT